VGFVGLQFPSEAFGQAASGWTTLLDGSGLDGWSVIGDANWRVAEGTVQADQGAGFLVSKESYGDFELRAEFWVDDDANSGIFIRCSDPQKPAATSSYEVNIFDKRPDPAYATGGIVNIAKPPTVVKAGGKWNTMEITARGPRMTVKMNGAVTSEGQDSKFASGPLALQRSAGVVKFRKLEIRRL